MGSGNGKRERNGLMELDSARNHIRNSGLDCFRFLGYCSLPSNHLKFPKKKVLSLSLPFFSTFFFLILKIIIVCGVLVLCSVVGLNFDFVVLNLTKHSSYLIYNATLYFSSTVQTQYLQKFGFGQVYVCGPFNFQNNVFIP